ncbi:DNA (cytosine-5-)-methyltransferase [Bacillus sp. MCCB 382]|nr:DNA (cytosine-5-)-methyltransferase [Bacillus sp. MCCB 382]
MTTNINEVNEIPFEGKPFTYVSLFSGIGGFEQALNKLGGTCVMASEIDKFANQSYELLYGHKTVGDITKVEAEDVPNHDVLVGGFPCQAFSVAGKRLGFSDTRGTLFFEIARLAKVKRPKALLLENVKGLVGHDKGKTLDTIVTTLNDIGYTVDFNVLNSKYFGVPQNRERIFIIAMRDDLVKPAKRAIEGTNVVAKGKRRIADLPGVKTFNFNWPEQTEVTTRLRDVLEPVVDERYYLSEEKTAKLVTQLRVNNDPLAEDQIRATLTPDREEKRQQGRRFKENDEPAFTLNTQDRHGILDSRESFVKSVGNTNPSGNGMNGKVFDIEAGLSPTITTNKGEGLRITSAPHYHIRKLTPLECFRLQGFPDSAYETLSANGVSNSQLYKQAGNAVTVNVIDAIGSRLLPMIGGEA